jgi:hypothetical protein
MNKTILLAILAGGFLLGAAWLFGVEDALKLFEAVQPAGEAVTP